MKIRLTLLSFALLLASACTTDSGSRTNIFAQNSPRTCSQDTDCRMRLPRARSCPNGRQSVPTACCRMNFCGVCWSECNG
ncbi:MAG: hypothetical protein Q8Q09_24925 [Deltaproteobacteria bacterium]|nr:hypothetical protein [Deltaproteobacteria bacterium]